MEDLDRIIADFFASAPLHKKLKLDFSLFGTLILGNIVDYYCPHCKVNRPFRNQTIKSTHRSAGIPVASMIVPITFLCTGCGKEKLVVCLEVNSEGGYICKIGQLPQMSIRPPKEVEEALAGNVILYNRARICINHNYGLAALAYMRRIIEDMIDPILKLIYEHHESENSAPEVLDEIRQTIVGKEFSEKAKLANRYAPASLKVEGANPLKIIHDQFSVGIHGLDEDQCNEIARKLLATIDYVVPELKRTQTARVRFSREMKQLNAKKRSS